MSNPNEIMTPKEVALYLKTSVDWVQAHATRKSPRLKGMKLGKHLRFRRGDIEQFLEESKIPGRIQ